MMLHLFEWGTRSGCFFHMELTEQTFRSKIHPPIGSFRWNCCHMCPLYSVYTHTESYHPTHLRHHLTRALLLEKKDREWLQSGGRLNEVGFSCMFWSKPQRERHFAYAMSGTCPRHGAIIIKNHYQVNLKASSVIFMQQIQDEFTINFMKCDGHKQSKTFGGANTRE